MDKDNTLLEVMSHYRAWTDDNNKRATRKGGWNEITDAYYGVLPKDWPFTSRVTDPRIRTSLIEKNSRLVNGKLRGRLAPRESGDSLTAQINNSVLDYQWDTANDGGSMGVKIGVADLDTRLYGSKFALVKWKYEETEDGVVKFDGNEVDLLDIRDCGMDFSASHIRGAKWFQHRSWDFVEDLERQSDVSGQPLFKNIDVLKRKIEARHSNGKAFNSSTKKNAYDSRVKTIRGLEERVGTDMAYPVIELVTEYRQDRWITFSPEFQEIIRDIPNPYSHGKIPVAQLRYYPAGDDAFGESEVEPVLPIWKAIQATVCAYLDEVVLKMRPPLKIIEGSVRIETIKYGPEEQWIMSRPDAVTEMQSNGEAVKFFQTTYSALVAAFNTAMGDMSQGTSGVDPFNPDKTATEVKATMKQQNSRDQKNQSDLAEFIKDIMLMWCSNNKQFLFSDPKKTEHIIRIVGSDAFNYFKRAGLDEMEVTPEAMQTVADAVTMNPEVNDLELQLLLDSAKTPKYPVFENANEKDPTKLKYKPKMRVSDMGDSAELSIVPQDLDGTYDYIPDVKSMALGASEELMQGRQRAVELFTSNPNVIQMLAQEGFKPKIKEILRSNLEDFGLKDAERYFEKLDESVIPGAGAAGGFTPPVPTAGIPTPQGDPGGGIPQQMAGPGGI